MSDDAGGLRDRLRDGLPAAIKARDGVAVAALRSALAAIENAEAVAPPPGSPTEATHDRLAGTVAGVGAAEAERRALSEAEVEEIARGEVDERRAAADAYERAGRADPARRLRAEADVLGGYLARRP
ncbi:MAG TPA: GatB/YqeY domain-containing protein [Actinomycetota bacterium]|jgi:uncharacterized protein YqeY|nr:GatB/YqeY domain-containing protein [Actinomycetota bacterium]